MQAGGLAQQGMCPLDQREALQRRSVRASAYAGQVNAVPSTSRIDIVVHTGDAEWWQIVADLGPLVVLLVAGITWLILRQGAFVATAPVDDKTSAGSQSVWWSRARWALEATLADKPARREVGFAALELLSTSRLSGKEETLIIAEAWKRPLGDSKAISRLAEKVSTGNNDLQNGLSPEERVIIRPARLRLSTEKKQGMPSPIWIEEIAKLTI